MPDELLERIDEFASEHGYTGRSEVVREAARNLMGEFDDWSLEGRDLIALVTVVFNYETTSVEQRLMALRHSHDSLVTSNVHSHVGDTYCMEVFILEGQLTDISEFVGQVRAIHTAGCNKLKEFATPGWRISLRTYSRQYQDTLTVDYSVTPVDSVENMIESA